VLIELSLPNEINHYQLQQQQQHTDQSIELAAVYMSVGVICMSQTAATQEI